MEKIRFAFAVNKFDEFENKHFGDAYQYLIYEIKIKGKGANYVDKLINILRDKESKHGSVKKGKGIISLLQERNINVLVSKKFGPNINMVNKKFIPVIINDDELNSVIQILKKHINWLLDELNKKSDSFSVFNINEGILKYKLK